MGVVASRLRDLDVPGSGGTAPFNRPTAYILFSGFYSVFYLLDYLIFVPLTYAALTMLWPTSRPWQ